MPRHWNLRNCDSCVPPQKSEVAQVAKDTYVIMAFKLRFRDGEKENQAFFRSFHAVP